MADKDISESSLIERLVAEPSDPPEVAVLVGHIGRSTDATQVRIYPSVEDLQTYMEMKREDVLHTEAASAEDGTRLLVRAEAKISRVSMTTARELSKLRMRTSPLNLNKETLRTLASLSLGLEEEADAQARPSRTRCTFEYRCTSARSCSLSPCC